MIADRPKVFIIDNDCLVRSKLERLVESKGYRVESFTSAREFLQREMLPQQETDAEAACLVLEANLPGLNGLGLQNFLLERGVLLPLIFTADHADIPTAVRALQSGAISFLVKPFEEREVMSEIENAFAVWRNEFLQRSEIADFQQRYGTLTAREKEIFFLAGTGKRNKQTAYELGIAEDTVKVHRCRVMKKMGAESIAELALMARKLKAAPDNLWFQPLPRGPSHSMGQYAC